MNVLGYFICDSPKLETTQILTPGKWINKLWYSHVMKYYKKKTTHQAIDIHMNMDEFQNNYDE